MKPDEGGFFPLIWFVSCEKDFEKQRVEEVSELCGEELE